MMWRKYLGNYLGALPQDGDSLWMQGMPVSDMFGLTAPLGVHNPAAMPEKSTSGYETGSSLLAQDAGRTALHDEVAIEPVPVLPENLPLHQRGFHPAELRSMLMRAGVAAQNAEQLSDDPRRGDVTNGVYELFTVLSDHEDRLGRDTWISAGGLIEISGIPGAQAEAIARTYDIANAESDSRE